MLRHMLPCGTGPDTATATATETSSLASIGIVLCIAEGAGRCSGPDKRRFYEMARGRATESAAMFDILRARGLVGAQSHAQARLLLVRIVQILTRMSDTPRDR